LSESESETYLIFRLQNTLYGVPSVGVREILPLLWLSVVEEQPAFIRGVINLRGRILPVLDLNARFGRTTRPLHLSDRIVVLEINGQGVGVIVEEVCEVGSLALENQEALPIPQESGERFVHALARYTTTDDEVQIVVLLDTKRLLENTLTVFEENTEKENIEEKSGDAGTPTEFNEFSIEECATLQQRAREFAQPLLHSGEHEGSEEGAAAVVVMLGTELRAIRLTMVQEFLPRRAIIPIPGADACVAGVMSVRGDIIALLRLGDKNSEDTTGGVVVVLNISGDRFGLLVERVMDIIPVEKEQEVVSYNDQLASVMDVSTLHRLVF
jgi:purine-binding chemotaxis protein CheW